MMEDNKSQYIKSSLEILRKYLDLLYFHNLIIPKDRETWEEPQVYDKGRFKTPEHWKEPWAIIIPLYNGGRRNGGG
jgi:hypothetical protein